MQEKNADRQNEKAPEMDGSNPAANNIHGRVDHTANPEFKDAENEADISQVDRQEGTMNHGELGGNFKKEDE